MKPIKGVSTKHLSSYLAWFKWYRTSMAAGIGTAEDTVARQLANGACRTRIREMFDVLPHTWNTGVTQQHKACRMVAP